MRFAAVLVVWFFVYLAEQLSQKLATNLLATLTLGLEGKGTVECAYVAMLEGDKQVKLTCLVSTISVDTIENGIT